MTGPPLSPRELEVARLVGEGFNTKQIAERLHLKQRWIQCCITAIAFKVSEDHAKDDRVMVARWWWEHHDRPHSA